MRMIITFYIIHVCRTNNENKKEMAKVERCNFFSPNFLLQFFFCDYRVLLTIFQMSTFLRCRQNIKMFIYLSKYFKVLESNTH